MEQKLLAYLKEHEAEIFADLKELVLAEASTSDIDQLAHVREVLIRLIKERTGSDTFVYEAKGGHNPMKFEFGQGDGTVLLIGHYDTVCPIGSMELRQDEIRAGLRDLVYEGLQGSGNRSGKMPAHGDQRRRGDPQPRVQLHYL